MLQIRTLTVLAFLVALVVLSISGSLRHLSKGKTFAWVSCLLVLMLVVLGGGDTTGLWLKLEVYARIAAIPVIGFTLFEVAGKIARKSVRWPLRIVGSPLILSGTLLLSLAIMTDGGCTRTAPPIFSPGDGYVALTEFIGQGALGDDYGIVVLRRRWRPYFETVYNGLGFYDFQTEKMLYPEIRWLDRTHLRIRYSDDRTGAEGRGGPAMCLKRVGEIEIICEKVR